MRGNSRPIQPLLLAIPVPIISQERNHNKANQLLGSSVFTEKQPFFTLENGLSDANFQPPLGAFWRWHVDHQKYEGTFFRTNSSSFAGTSVKLVPHNCYLSVKCTSFTSQIRRPTAGPKTAARSGLGGCWMSNGHFRFLLHTPCDIFGPINPE